MHYFRILSRPGVFVIWSSTAISVLGDQIYSIGISWISAKNFGVSASYIILAQQAAAFVTAMFGGFLLNNRKPLNILQLSDAIRSVVLCLLFIQLYEYGPSYISILLVSITLGAFRSLYRPVLRGLVSTLSPSKDQIGVLISLFETTNRTSVLLGPAIAAIFQAKFTTTLFILINSFSFLISFISIRLASTNFLTGSLDKVISKHKEAAGQNVMSGFHFASKHKVIDYVVKVSGPITGIWYYVMFLGVPLLLQQHFIKDKTGLLIYSIYMGVYGTFNALTSFLMPIIIIRKSAILVVFGNMLMGFGFIIISTASYALNNEGYIAIILFGAAISAIGGPLEQVTANVIQAEVFAAAQISAIDRAILMGNTLFTVAVSSAVPTFQMFFRTETMVSISGLMVVLIGVYGIFKFRESF